VVVGHYHQGNSMKNIGMVKDLVRSAFQRPVTELYPAERRPSLPQFRGQLYWNPEGCTGCGLCVKDCPAEAIELIIIDKAEKRFGFRYYADRCTFCGQCVYNCRFNCIELVDDEWVLANTGREGYLIEYGRPEDLARYAMETSTTSSPEAG
jgi:formate hydrogenlyase subunit 6/NADH:ubiquinone oxidoreductase subunit I